MDLYKPYAMYELRKEKVHTFVSLCAQHLTLLNLDNIVYSYINSLYFTDESKVQYLQKTQKPRMGPSFCNFKNLNSHSLFSDFLFVVYAIQ